MKNSKWWMLLPVLLAFVVGVTPKAFAASMETVDGLTWKYTVSRGEATIESSAYDGTPAVSSDTSGDIAIPSSLGGYPVTHIGYSAFLNCSGLTSVTIPDGVTRIGDDAFSGCSGLTSVTIPDSVTFIGRQVFYGCSGLTNVTIGERVTSIGSSAFFNCSSLASVTIPESVTSIGDNAFMFCSALTNVTIPEGETSIGRMAFAYCSDLTSVTILGNVTTAWDSSGPFAECPNLSTIMLGEQITQIGDFMFSGCSGLTGVTIPAGVTNIGCSSFDNCNALYDTNTLPGVRLVDGWAVGWTEELPGALDLTGIRGIANYAFQGCHGLTNVTIPDNVTSIGNSTFAYCSRLTNVTIPDNVTSIGDSTFAYCSGLTSMTIPESVTSIGGSAFSQCSALTNVTIPCGMTRIGYGVFRDCKSLTNVRIPDSVTSIGNSAFSGCSGLANMSIPDSVTSIGEYAFSSCISLASMRISDSVTSIGYAAFYKCSGLTSVAVFNRETSIGQDAFSGCSELETLYVPAEWEWTSKLSEAGVPSGCTVVYGIPPEIETLDGVEWQYTVSNGVATVVGGRCSGAIEIPASLGGYPVEVIDQKTFRGCGELASVRIPDGVKAIGSSAFSGCINLKQLVIPSAHAAILEGVDIPDGCLVVLEGTDGSRTTQLNGFEWHYRLEDGRAVATAVRGDGECLCMPFYIGISALAGMESGSLAGCTALKWILAPWEWAGTGLDGVIVPEGCSISFNVHSGTLSVSQTWDEKTVHVVSGKLTVPGGVALTIEPGAVVKFLPGAGLIVGDGGECVANGVVFTPISDDSVGGDTMGDGSETSPETGQYTIMGAVADDESTEYRYFPPQVLAPTISSDTRLRGHRVYVVSNTVTVAAGATLTLQPGAILKFAPGRQLTVNGTLAALGTRSQPVVLTSLKDDGRGGDTNGDGDATRPAGGDWNGVWVYGRADFAYTELMYSGNGNEKGIVQTSGLGVLTMTGCTVAHALNDGIWNWGGTVAVTNSVFIDTGWATAPYRGTKNEFVNCVFHGNDVGMCYWAHWTGAPVYKNCIFSECAHGWCELASGSYGAPPSGVTVGHCDFWNPPGYGAQSCPLTGANGNVWGDPLFQDAENRDFRVAEGSPCVDAGDTGAAPETDLYGQPRVSAWGEAVADIGVYEVQPRGVAGDVDFVLVKVSADGTATPGGKLAVKWTVGNRGGKAAVTARRDTVSLVSASGRTVALGDVVVSRSVAAGGTVECSGSFTLPAMAEGTWYPKVVVNSYQDVFEGSLVANNALTGADSLEVAVAATDPVTGASGTVAAGAPTVLKLAFGAGNESRMVVLDVPAGVNVSWGFGFVPQGALLSGGTMAEEGVPVQFLAPESEEELDVYVVLESDTAATYELSTESTKLTVTDVTPETLPSSGIVTLTITGAGFTSTSQVTFSAGGRMVVPESIQADAGNLAVVVDCSNLLAGVQYDVTVADAGQEATLKDAISVIQEAGNPKIVWHLETPDSIRQGREYSGRIDFRNEGTSDAPMPIFILSGDAGTSLRLPETGGDGGSRVLWLLGISDDSFGALKPSEERSIHFYFKTTSPGNGRISCRILDELASIDESDATQILKTRFPGGGVALATLLAGTWGDFAERIRSFIAHTHRFATQETDVLSVVRSYLEWQENHRAVVRGHCLEWDGKAATGSVRLFLDADDEEVFTQRTETDGKGQYWFAGVASGRYTVRLGDEVAVETVDVGGAGTYDVDLTVEGNVEQSQVVCRGRVVDTDGNSIAGCKVSWWSGHELACVQTDGNGEFETVVEADMDGPFVFEADGYLSVVVANASSLFPDVAVVMAGGVYVQRLAIQSGEAVSNAFLIVHSMDSEELMVVTTDTEGRFAVTLSPGEYELQTVGGETIDTFFVANSTGVPSSRGGTSGIRSADHGEGYLALQESLAFSLAWAMGTWGGLTLQPQPGEFLMHELGPLGKNSGKPSRLVVDSGTVMSWFAKKYDTYKSMKAVIATEIEEVFAEAPAGAGANGRLTNTLVFAYGSDGDPNWKLLTPLGMTFGGTRTPTSWTAQLKSVVDIEPGTEKCHARLFVSAPDIYDFHFPFIADFVALQNAGWMTPFDSLLEIEDEYVFTRKKPAEMPQEPGTDGQENRFAVPQSYDPNEMAGPVGAGAARYVAPGEWMTYTVYFENKSTATAAAQEVSVSMALDGALDWGTFEVVDVGFNNQIDLGLGGKRKGASETAMTGTAYKVRTELDFDEKTGGAKWYMRIVDERTETRWPKDVFAGFLPPNDETGRGEGHITYRVKVREDAAAGTVVRASASIVFDYNAAIETDPSWWNTVAEMGEATVDLGNGVETNVAVMVGAPWGGQLPDPGKRQGMRFAGWFTGPDGTGEEVTEESLVEAGAKLYAFWDASAAPELWLDVSWGTVEIGTNGVVKGYAPDGNIAGGSANRYVLTGTSTVYGVKFAGGSFTNTWTNLCVKLGAQDAVAVALEGANVEVELAGDNVATSGKNCAGVRVDEESALVLEGTGRLEAQGGAYGAGIGGGRAQKSGRIEIRGGTVEAKGGDFGMGIGGGMEESGAEVVITGGSVKARGDRGEDIGSGDGEASVEAPKDGMGAPVYEVEVLFATDALPVTVAVDLGGGRTYQYEGMGHEGDSSLWFWLPDGTYEFEADGDDYGAHVMGASVAAVFTDPGSAHFEAPAAETLEATGEGWRVGLNPAYRTTPFELWTATALNGNDWNWEKVEKETYRLDAETGMVEWKGKTGGLRVFKFQFLPKE